MQISSSTKAVWKQRSVNMAKKANWDIIQNAPLMTSTQAR